MMITINLTATLDTELRSGKKDAGNTADPLREFQQLLTTHGLNPVPLFPDPRVPGFARIWHVSYPDRDAAALLVKLSRAPGVEAAYGKPEDDIPNPP
jgi:hypothetical protein